MAEKKWNLCNKAIMVINIIVFLVLEFLGDTESAQFMYEHGAMYPEAVLQEGEWYRLFTCIFMHFGITHLGNNMIMLIFLGDNLEQALGHIKYLLLYIVSGLCGSGLSLVFMEKSNDYAVSAGASGAIFGMIGALIYIVLCNRGGMQDLSAGRLVLMAVLSLYHGFTASGVDNMAHIGGMAGGLICAVLFYRKPKQWQYD